MTWASSNNVTLSQAFKSASRNYVARNPGF
jgi:hypothetical protein